MNIGTSRIDKLAAAGEVERKRFAELLNRWFESYLNRFFELNQRGSAYRKYWTGALVACFIAGAFIVHAIIYYYPILKPAPRIEFATLPLFLILTLSRLVIILLIPAYIAFTMAGNYLADIFELKDLAIAWDYIRELSFGRANEIIHIRDGMISEESLNSPVLLIGGPGRVLVEFDSAAMFEKPDGTPHVVGLANAGIGSSVSNFILEGFERLREPIINLRDQYIGNPSGESMTVVSRSLEGIPVSASAVRAVFSIRRETAKAGKDSLYHSSYTFNPDDIESLIYKQEVPVVAEGLFPSGLPEQWTNTMQDLICSSLSEYMRGKNLAEYLASIGPMELELAELREDTILSKTIESTNQLPASMPESIDRPRFNSRTELSDRFTKNPNGFPKTATERGLELHWIDVGTWRLPDEISREIIEDQHLEAWRLNQENTMRSEPGAVQSFADEAFINEKMRLVQDVPLAAHQKNQAKYKDKNILVECLLQNYWEQLGEALEIYYRKGANSADLDTVEKAVLILENLLKIPQGQHVIGGGTMSKVRSKPPAMLDQDAPPAPESRYEAEQYSILLSKLDGNYKVAEGMLSNEARRYPSLSRESLIQRILIRFERYGR